MLSRGRSNRSYPLRNGTREKLGINMEAKENPYRPEEFLNHNLCFSSRLPAESTAQRSIGKSGGACSFGRKRDLKEGYAPKINSQRNADRRL